MSERDEFEAWKRSINPTILFLRHDHNGSNLMDQYASMIIEDQWQAWQAARATPQQALTAQDSEHAHDWRFSLQDHVYKCDCGETRGDYPFGAASFKD